MTPDSPTQTRPALGYVPALDGVRGLAILFVLGNHAPLGPFESLLPGGFSGVDIFFVLSGFLITTLLVQEFDRTGSISLRNFYLRRALRLGPALLLFLIVFCIMSFVLFDHAQARKNCFDALIALFYASNWVRVFTKNQLGFLAHTWSLSAEEQFYILWPLILLTLLRFSKKRHYVALAAAAIALLSWLTSILLAANGATFRRLCFGLDGRVDTLMIGCILGVVMSSGLLSEKATKAAQKILVVMAPLSLACLLAFAKWSYLLGRSFFYYGFVALALLSATLIFDILISPRSMIKRLFTMKWLVWIGSVSYGLYLWHWPIYQAMLHFGMKGTTVVLLGTPLTFLIVILSYYLMERPLLKLKKRFTTESQWKLGASESTITGEHP